MNKYKINCNYTMNKTKRTKRRTMKGRTMKRTKRRTRKGGSNCGCNNVKKLNTQL
jgi:hypothetical protein